VPKNIVEAENPFESFNQTTIVKSVLAQMKEIEDLSCTLESDDSASLPEGHGGNPNGYEPVLAKRQTEVGVASNLKKEFAVAPRVSELAQGRPAKRKTAEHEGTGMEGEFLIAVFALLTNEQDGLHLLPSAFRDINRGGTGRKGNGFDV
jgi:hypothetical protein